MCSSNDVDGNCENFVLPEKPSFSENTTCRSCSNRGLVLFRKKDVYCRDCFLAAETHKFRAALGKSKLMKPQDRVLVAYSGSQSSAALLHLLHSGVIERQHKKLLFCVHVLFVDEGAILNLEIDKRQELVESIANGVKVYDFPFFVTSLGESLKESPVLGPSLKIDEKHDKQVIEMFLSVKSVSSKEDLLHVLKQKLILKAAEQLNCNKVFTAEDGNDIAVKLLTSFSLGRGETASIETGFCDSHHPTIKILRPLRDFTRKEIVFYNRFHNVESVCTPSLTTKSPSSISIQKLTEKFVTELQREFPSTVYTIFRTGEKLSVKAVDEQEAEDSCALCKNKMRTRKKRNTYSAVEAAEFSRNVSRRNLNNCEIKQNGSCCGSCSNSVKPLEIDTKELEKFMCYGCALILRDMKNINVLPMDTLKTALEKKDLEAMREQISEFLIENPPEVEI